MEKSQLVLDGSQEFRDKIKEEIEKDILNTQPDVDERKTKYKVRRDFWEGRQETYSNVVGLKGKEREGHISAVFNYVWKMGEKVYESITNFPFKIKMVSDDEADEEENIRTEALEKAIKRVLSDNNFFEVIFDRCSVIQVRDADFALKCTVKENEEEGKFIHIEHADDMEKVSVMWDDSAGKSFSGFAFCDEWTLEKIRQEFDYEAEAMGGEDVNPSGSSSHGGNEYGLLGGEGSTSFPSGKNKIPKQKIVDYWGRKYINDTIKGTKVKGWKIVNAIIIGKDMIQFEVTDYKDIPWFIGHSYPNPRYPWSISFIDPLLDAQTELNDRQSEEGDLIRIGSHMKFLVYNMPDFDEKSLKPGSGQVIFIEGENADFKPLTMNVTPFPSESYINRTLEHLFTLGLPKIAFAAGTAPYTGRVGALQYQSVVDPVNKMRTKWELVLKGLFHMIQEYMRDYFPETASFMRSHAGGVDGDIIIREVEFDWENILPMSKSDMIVDASTLYDRDAIPLRKYLELAGLEDAPRIIKELKKESQDDELLTARGKFKELSRAATQARILAQKQTMDAEEANGAVAGEMANALSGATPAQPKPIMHTFQNQGEAPRGISSAKGVPQTGQVSQMGASRAVTQNTNAQG